MNVRMDEVREIWRKLPRKDWASVRQAFQEHAQRRGEDAGDVLRVIGRFEQEGARFPGSPEQLERMLQGPLSESARARHEHERVEARATRQRDAEQRREDDRRAEERWQAEQRTQGEEQPPRPQGERQSEYADSGQRERIASHADVPRESVGAGTRDEYPVVQEGDSVPAPSAARPSPGAGGAPATATATRTALSTATARAVIRVSDYDRAKRFYQEVLGLTVRDMAAATSREGFAEAGNGTGFGFYERPAMPAAQNTVMSFDVEDVEAAVQELRSRGVRFEEYDLPDQELVTQNGIATMRGQKVAWFKDPEGNIFSVGCTCR